MIELSIEPYCQQCPKFEADIARKILFSENHVVACDTTVFCKRRDDCAVIAECIRREN